MRYPVQLEAVDDKLTARVFLPHLALSIALYGEPLLCKNLANLYCLPTWCSG